MTIRLLGTGAADGIPGFYTANPVSRFALEVGGKEIRTRAAALIDGSLKIDLPPDTLAQMHRDRLNARDWSAILFTHSHEDHLAVSELQYALYPFTELEELPCTIYGNAVVLRTIRERYPDWPLELVEFQSFQPVARGDFRITPVEANHVPEEHCHNLIVEREGKAILYATDTGVWSSSSFAFLSGRRVDALVIECTEGFMPTDYAGHLDVETCIQVVQRLRKEGALAPDARVVTTHHASQGGARHCDLETALTKFGIEPGYDGMEVVI